MKKIIILIIIIIILIFSLFLIIPKKEKNISFDHVYISSSLPSHFGKKSEIILTDKNGVIKHKIKLGKTSYYSIYIDSNSKIHTIGSNENFRYVYDYKSNSLERIYLGKTDNEKECKGNNYIMFEINNDIVSILTENVDKNYVHYQDKCYEIPSELYSYNYDKTTNKLLLETNNLIYEIDFNNKIINEKNVEDNNLVKSSIFKNYSDEDYIYSTQVLLDNKNNNIKAQPDKIIYLIKRNKKDYKIVEKKEIDRLTYGNNENHNESIAGLFNNNKYYYLKYKDGQTNLEIYDLNFNLIDNQNITRNEWNNKKLDSRFTKIIDNKLHFFSSNTHYIYDYDNKKYEKVINIDVRNNYHISNFDVKKTN